MAPSPSAAREPEQIRVLFIGNSYTRFNFLPRQVARLSESVPDGPRVRTRWETHGGFDLRRHWRRAHIRRLVRSGRFDKVVIQDHSLSPINHPDRLAEYARRFHDMTSAAGAQLVLFETWARHPANRLYRRGSVTGPQEMLARVQSVYGALGRELGALVAPVGHAWMRAHEELPEMRLHRRDGTHPALEGTYLSACVLYRTLTGRDPRAASWRPWRMRPEVAERIRNLAATIH